MRLAQRPDIGPAMSARWWLLSLPTVAARLFVSFRGAARNDLRARQSRASIPAYRDMQLEAHRIQDTQNGSEIWMFRLTFKGTLKILALSSPDTLAMSEMLYRRMAAPMA